MMEFQECMGGITAPRGFRAAGVHCGLKRHTKDLALIVSDVPAVAAAMFTTNKVQAAPLLVDQEQLKTGSTFRAVVVNSGNANAATGEKGLEDAWTMVNETASLVGVAPTEVFVSSTGVIGQYLPMEKVIAGIKQAAKLLSKDHHSDAAQAIMTTDTFPKEVAVRLTLAGATVTIGGMAKGSGMIAPQLAGPPHATMLAYVTTDTDISQVLLQSVLEKGVSQSLNRITVDGDTSTNDTILALANGTAGNAPLEAGSPDLEAFSAAFEALLKKLAKMIARDGEGATKLIEITVTGARSEEEAAKAASAIARSNLVKTAVHGEDANWGRILAAVGYSGIDFNPAETMIYFGDLKILGKNYSIEFSEEEAKKILAKCQVKLTVQLNSGPCSATFWTCDLSKEYVRINASYRS